MVTEDQIKTLAYTIWEEEGRPDGRDLEHYLRAKKLLEEREAKQALELTSPPPIVKSTNPLKVHLPSTPIKRNIRARNKKK